MATLDKILQFIANKLSTLENKTLKEEIITLGSTWTAKYDGTLVRIGRANAESAYMFCSDITNGQSGNFRGLATIQTNQTYATLTIPVLKGHTYRFENRSWGVQKDIYTYYEE